MGIRFSLLIGITTLVFAGLVFHLYHLQIERGEYYFARAEEHSQFEIPGEQRRGDIFFTEKNGDRVSAATDKEFPEIYAVPRDIEDALEVANIISPVVDMPADKLMDDFSDQGDVYVRLASKATNDQVAQIEKLNISGIKIRSVSDRVYPFGDLAAHVLGFVGPNKEDSGKSGKYGTEKQYNEILKDIGQNNAVDGIRLTIDPTIQSEAEKILNATVEKHRARGGSVIVQDPDTGKILALANAPSFNPNTYSESPISNFLNSVTQRQYEPGSVFKPITLVSALDAGAVTPNTTFYDSGKLVVGDHTIRNWDLKAHESISMANILEKSINIGAALVARKLGEDQQKKYLEKFGFGKKTGIDLPNEVSGDIGNLHENAPPLNFATASFGQGIAATPLQVINAFSTIANGGTLMRPYINSELGPSSRRRVVSKKAAFEVTDMLISAVDKAQVAKLEGYTVAGKTGTAQVADLINGGYGETFINTYVGFAPAGMTAEGSRAEFTILFKLDEPEGAPLAGLTVVPAFRDLAQFILNYYQVPPNRVTVTE